MVKISEYPPKYPWQGSFDAASDREAVIEQIKHNSNYWRSDKCKLDTVLTYLRDKGIKDPEAIIKQLARDGSIMFPSKGYVALVSEEIIL